MIYLLEIPIEGRKGLYYISKYYEADHSPTKGEIINEAWAAIQSESPDIYIEDEYKLIEIIGAVDELPYLRTHCVSASIPIQTSFGIAPLKLSLIKPVKLTSWSTTL
jgi:hypothetical protein